MSQTLSRKYRPQTFKEVVGQNHIKITLQNEVLSEQIAHAYLFTGPRGIGKTSMARILAKSLNCQNRQAKDFEPCNQCSSCQEITSGRALDLIEIDAATHTQVDKVRENIIENINFAPHHKYKIFIIDEVHMLSTAAFNALLKTLEEPPEYAVFILCTTQAYKIPETIISRCQRFDFKKINTEQIADKLKKIARAEKIKIKDDVLATIALRSGGFIRDAESLLSQIAALLSSQKKEIALEDVAAVLPRSDLHSIAHLAQALINNHAQQGIEIINQLIIDGVDLERFNLDLIDYLRKIILVKFNLKDKDNNIAALPEEIKNKLIKQAQEVEISKLIKILEIFITKQPAIKEAEIYQLPLEMAVIEVCNADETLMKADYADNKKPAITEDTETTSASVPKGTTADRRRTQKKIQSSQRNSESSVLATIEQIKNAWPQIIKECQKLNHSLPLILKSAYPLAVKNNQLELGFEFEIHLTKIKQEKCLNLVEQILADTLGAKLKVKPIILPAEKIQALKESQPAQANAKSQDSQPEINNGQLEEIAKSFGGKVVE